VRPNEGLSSPRRSVNLVFVFHSVVSGDSWERLRSPRIHGGSQSASVLDVTGWFNPPREESKETSTLRPKTDGVPILDGNMISLELLDISIVFILLICVLCILV
jgi:hypothetical protein